MKHRVSYFWIISSILLVFMAVTCKAAGMEGVPSSDAVMADFRRMVVSEHIQRMRTELTLVSGLEIFAVAPTEAAASRVYIHPNEVQRLREAYMLEHSEELSLDLKTALLCNQYSVEDLKELHRTHLPLMSLIQSMCLWRETLESGGNEIMETHAAKFTGLLSLELRGGGQLPTWIKEIVPLQALDFYVGTGTMLLETCFPSNVTRVRLYGAVVVWPTWIVRMPLLKVLDVSALTKQDKCSIYWHDAEFSPSLEELQLGDDRYHLGLDDALRKTSSLKKIVIHADKSYTSRVYFDKYGNCIPIEFLY